MPTGQSPRSTDLVTKSIQIPSPSQVGETTDVFSAVPIGPDDATQSGGRIAMVTATPLPAFTVFPHLPGYQVVCELGRGGMGVVYRAKQERLKRTVAVKMLLNHDAADAADVIRFRSEAEAVASIAHPHVVKVYESGQHDGRSYFTMEYLPGGSLHAKLRAKAPFPPADAARLVEKLARAVHAAHSLGIVHRDLKPGNVLFDADGEPRVTDFGLAKRTACELTRTQAVMGTPAYMPPEQAAGRAKYVGPPADIYALGVILYECLSGCLPFAASDSLALLNQVIAQEPPPIRLKVPTVPRDLELICLKCLEKGPADRYQTAAELADDLRRFTNREPVSVRPAGRIERLVKWARRRPTLAAAYGLGLLVAALAVLGGGMAVLAYQAVTARNEANAHYLASEQAREQLEQQADELERSHAAEVEHRQKAEQARDALVAKHEQVQAALAGEQKAKEAAEKALDGERKAKTDAAEAHEAVERLHYFANVALAQKEAAAGNFLRAADLLDQCPEARRGWEWWYAYRVTHTDYGCGLTWGRLPTDVAFTGRQMDLTTAHPGGQVVPFVFDEKEGKARRVGPADSTLYLSADGKRAVAVRNPGKSQDDGVTVWELDGDKKVATFPSPKEPCRTCELSADGKRVVFQFFGQPVRGFDVDTGKEVSEFKCELAYSYRMRLSADGRTAAGIVSAGDWPTHGTEAVVWDVDAGKELRRATCDCGKVCAVGLSPDGKTVVTASPSGEVRFHPAGGKPVGVKRAHAGQVTAVVFSPDGTRAATAGDDGAVRVWNPATGEAVGEYHGHTRQVTCLAFHQNGTRLASCDAYGGFRVWALDLPITHTYRLGGLAPKMAVAFALDAEMTRVFAADDASDLGTEWRRGKTRDTPGTLYHVRAPEGTTFTAAALHPDGKGKALGTARGEVYLQTDAGENPQPLDGLKTKVKKLRFSADGARLLGTCQDELRVWDAATGKRLRSEPVVNVAAVSAISADGKRVVARFDRRAIFLYQEGEEKGVLVYSPEDVSLVEFTPDGEGVVVGTREWGLTLYPLTAFKDKAVLSGGKRYVGHTSPVTSVGFSPDSARIVGGAADGSVRVWDTATGNEAIGLSSGTEPVRAVWFADGGKLLVALPETGPPMLFDGSPRFLTLRPDRPLPK